MWVHVVIVLILCRTANREERVKFTDVRLATPRVKNVTYKDGDEVEVFSRTSETEPYGWWHARVKMMKGDFAVVEYLTYESAYNEIAELDRVRPLNRK